MSPLPLILASSSPRRLTLLGQIGIVPVQVLSPDIDETPRRGELPRPYAARMALAKAAALPSPDHLVLAADTVVAAGRRILPKAETAVQVVESLRLLSGRRHRVLTAIALAAPGRAMQHRLVESVVTFNRLTETQIARYADTGEGIGKAGGYAINGHAASFIRFLSGSYSGVVGLPLFETAQLLRGHGWDLP
ncbi:MAG TPA: Maf family nucleotide pyrophosphatase [Rhodopila sp.]|uniref:Maf family protein n=1 Tax=Rhodopila sp. TaxID=2480087 RepID=UPI002C7905AB|nr:Maf family nucleotide pyrophosphatase [Rhodopila sp.]HVY18370.1 Maf family nucleotide pyrophosphatase [Rhodopila sp.]